MPRQPYLRMNFGKQNAGRPLSASQLVAEIRDQILAEKVSPGCRLPPVRALAHQLGISKNTVQTAYNELAAQGVAESKKRVGLFVAPLPPQVGMQSEAQVPAPALMPLPSERGRRHKILADAIHMSSVFIDPNLLPREKLAACFRTVLKQPGLDVGYHDQGFLPLRRKIAERLNKRGIAARAEDVVTTVGSQQALDILCRVVARKTIATEDPAYAIGKRLFEMNNMQVVGLPVDPFQGIALATWEHRIARARPGIVYLTTNFHNPTGYSYSTQELSRIIAWSQTYHFGIVEDDWGSDMLSFSEFKPSLRARGGDGVFYINTFTKKLLPSLRLGYIVGNKETVPALVASKIVSCLGISPVVEAAVFEFLDRGYYDVYMKQLQEELDKRYQNCLNALRKTMPEDVKWTSPGGGPILWLEVPKRVNLEKLRCKLAERGVMINMSHDAFFGHPHLNGFRIGYALLPPSKIQQGVDILSEELKKMLKKENEPEK